MFYSSGQQPNAPLCLILLSAINVNILIMQTFEPYK